MQPLQLSVTIARPREEVFAYLADVANHAEFTDHYLTDWRLTREDSRGRGAGARFRVKAPFQRFDWADITFLEVEEPYRIVQVGRTGKYNRIRVLSTYTLHARDDHHTRVEFEIDTQPRLPSDRVMEALARPWLRRKAAKGLRRLRSILEEDRARGRRVTVAAR